MLVKLEDAFQLSRDRMEAIELAMEQLHDRCIRIRSDRPIHPLPWPTDVVPWYPQGRWLIDSQVRPSQFPHYVASDYYIQDAGSLLALALLAPQSNEWICDLCAAPGGKASAILEQLGEGGFLIANEPIRTRLDILEWALTRTGNPRFSILNRDPEDLLDAWSHRLDAILVDAPCSGQTLIGRGKRSDNAFDETQVLHSAARQRRILQAALGLLKPGGRLIYSTCTFAMEENEHQIRWLRETYGDLLEPIELPELSAWASGLEPGCYRTWPDRDRCAGSFAAALRLCDTIDISNEQFSTNTENTTRRKSSKKNVASSSSTSRSRTKESLQAFGHIENLEYWKEGDRWQGVASDVSWIAKESVDRFPSLAGGVDKSLQPHPMLALLPGTHFQPNHTFALNAAEAMAFARGEALPISPMQAVPPNGSWTVATWEGKPLGWMKSVGSRMNNYYPKIARLSP